MPAPLVECIPNFSEARRPEVVEEIIGVIKAIPGIQVLDRHSDLDHNRSVVTYVGSTGSGRGSRLPGHRQGCEIDRPGSP